MSKLFSKSLLITGLCLTIAACGGGGEGSTQPSSNNGGATAPVASLNFSLSNSSVELNENESKTITASVNYTGSGTLTYSYSESQYADISINGNVITIDAKEVDSDQSYSVDVTLTDGSLTKSQSMNIDIKNIVPDYPLTLSFVEQSMVVAEGSHSVTSFTTTYEGNEQIDYSVSYSGDISGLTDNVSGNELKLSANNLENDTVVTLTLTAVAGNSSDSATIELQLENTSAIDVLAESGLWSNEASVYAFDDFDNIAEVYVKAAYFNANIKNSEKEIYLADFMATVASSRASADHETNQALDNAISDYGTGTITETQLIEKLNSVKLLATNESNKILEKMNELSQLGNGSLPEINSQSYRYIEEYSTFSAIVGEEQMGSFTGESWEFSNNYAFFNQLVPSLGQTSTCLAN